MVLLNIREYASGTQWNQLANASDAVECNSFGELCLLAYARNKPGCHAVDDHLQRRGLVVL